MSDTTGQLLNSRRKLFLIVDKHFRVSNFRPGRNLRQVRRPGQGEGQQEEGRRSLERGQRAGTPSRRGPVQEDSRTCKLLCEPN